MPSSVIRAFAYDPATRRLRVTFVTGRIYLYEDVPPDVVAQFQAARSRGQFFNARVRDAYEFREVEGAQTP